MELVGDKICANLLAQSVGVNVIPWSGSGLKSPGVELSKELIAQATLRDVAAAEKSAEKVGFPLMIKVTTNH
jgi:acetyl-CoA carboxylase/biotin carboxylase 1